MLHPPPRSRHSIPNIPALTGLRGFAAWWVVSYHFREFFYLAPAWLISFFSKGYLAVDIFFILSGFVIYISGNGLAQNPNLQKYLTFVRRRFSRIYPVHLFMLLVYLLLPAAIVIFSKSKQIPQAFSIESFIANLFLLQAWGFIDYLSWNVAAWAISSLFAAYLLFPIIGPAI